MGLWQKIFRSSGPADPAEICRRYAGMSDDELCQIRRTDLTEIAQKCYDEEVASRSRYQEMSEEDFWQLIPQNLGEVERRLYEREQTLRDRPEAPVFMLRVAPA